MAQALQLDGPLHIASCLLPVKTAGLITAAVQVMPEEVGPSTQAESLPARHSNLRDRELFSDLLQSLKVTVSVVHRPDHGCCAGDGRGGGTFHAG